MRFDGKRGQVTPFIILGIIIVVVAVILIFFISPRVGRPAITTTAQIDPVRDYVGECIRKQIVKDLPVLKENAGYLGSTHTIPDLYNGEYINYIADRREKPYISKLNIFEDVISERIKLALEDCDLSVFRQFNIDNRLEEINVKTIISDNIVGVNVEYPIFITMGDSRIELRKFSVVVEDNLGKFYSLMKDIAIEETNMGDYAEFIPEELVNYEVANPDIKIERASFITSSGDYTIYELRMKGQEEGVDNPPIIFAIINKKE